MTITQIKNLIDSFIDMNVYFCIQGEDAKLSNQFRVVDIISDTMIQYKGGFDFEEEVVLRIRDELSEYNQTEIEKEIKRVGQKNKRRKGIFIILSPIV